MRLLTQHVSSSSTITTTVEATSFSIGPDLVPTPHTETETLTIPTVVSWTLSASTSVVRRDLEPRAKHDVTGVWMLHPWTSTVICYECYTKNPGQFGWVKCNSGPGVTHSCGPRPVDVAGNAVTTTATQTTSTTTSLTTNVVFPGTHTLTNTVALPASSALPIAPRSWHRKVHFQLPWTKARACADAEWEKRGKQNFEIRLQDVHVDAGNDCKDAFGLDLPNPIVETDTATTTIVDTLTNPSFPYTATTTLTLYTSEFTSVVTFTPTPAPVFSLIKTITTLVSSTVTLETVVPSETVTTVLSTASAAARAEVPRHRDL